MPGGQSDYSTDYVLGFGPQPESFAPTGAFTDMYGAPIKGQTPEAQAIIDKYTSGFNDKKFVDGTNMVDPGDGFIYGYVDGTFVQVPKGSDGRNQQVVRADGTVYNNVIPEKSSWEKFRPLVIALAGMGLAAAAPYLISTLGAEGAAAAVGLDPALATAAGAADAGITLGGVGAGEFALTGGTALSGLPAAAATGLDVGAATAGALSSSVGAIPSIAAPSLANLLSTPGYLDPGITMDSVANSEYALSGNTPLSDLSSAANTGLDVGAATTGALSSSVGAIPNIASPQLSDILNRFGTPGVPDVPGTGAPSTGGLPDLPKPDLDKLLTALGAFALNRSGIGSDGGGGGGSGYQGGIPTLQYNRTQLDTNDPNRRPGSAGRNYFSPGTFTPAPQQLAEGGLAGLAKPKSGAEPRYLNGSTDGMADKLPAKIDGGEPAQLSHGEFVIPADVVGHLGNGNSEAGAKRLYEMMDRIRHARTGNKEQGRRVDPNKFLPG